MFHILQVTIIVILILETEGVSALQEMDFRNQCMFLHLCIKDIIVGIYCKLKLILFLNSYL